MNNEVHRERKLDRSSRKTRAALGKALIRLLKEKPLKSITVKELAEIADVNRATFYVHFTDIYDMYEQLIEDFCDLIATIVDKHANEVAHNNFNGLINDLFKLVYDYQDDLSVIWSNNVDGTLLLNATEVVRERCMATVEPERTAKQATQNSSAVHLESNTAQKLFCYQFDYVAGGILSLIRDWLNSGCKEPIDVMTTIACTFVSGNAKEAFEKNVLLLSSTGI